MADNFLSPVYERNKSGQPVVHRWVVHLDQLPDLELEQPAETKDGRHWRSIDQYFRTSGDLLRKFEALLREAEAIAAPPRALATLRRCLAEVNTARSESSAVFMETEWSGDRELIVVAKWPKVKV